MASSMDLPEASTLSTYLPPLGRPLGRGRPDCIPLLPLLPGLLRCGLGRLLVAPDGRPAAVPAPARAPVAAGTLPLVSLAPSGEGDVELPFLPLPFAAPFATRTSGCDSPSMDVGVASEKSPVAVFAACAPLAGGLTSTGPVFCCVRGRSRRVAGSDFGVTAAVSVADVVAIRVSAVAVPFCFAFWGSRALCWAADICSFIRPSMPRSPRAAGAVGGGAVRARAEPAGRDLTGVGAVITFGSGTRCSRPGVPTKSEPTPVRKYCWTAEKRVETHQYRARPAGKPRPMTRVMIGITYCIMPVAWLMESRCPAGVGLRTGSAMRSCRNVRMAATTGKIWSESGLARLVQKKAVSGTARKCGTNG